MTLKLCSLGVHTGNDSDVSSLEACSHSSVCIYIYGWLTLNSVCVGVHARVYVWPPNGPVAIHVDLAACLLYIKGKKWENNVTELLCGNVGGGMSECGRNCGVGGVEVGVGSHGLPFFSLSCSSCVQQPNMAIYFFSSKNRLGKIFPVRQRIDGRVRLVSKVGRSHRTLCFATCTWGHVSASESNRLLYEWPYILLRLDNKKDKECFSQNGKPDIKKKRMTRPNKKVLTYEALHSKTLEN